MGSWKAESRAGKLEAGGPGSCTADKLDSDAGGPGSWKREAGGWMTGVGNWRAEKLQEAAGSCKA